MTTKSFTLEARYDHKTFDPALDAQIEAIGTTHGAWVCGRAMGDSGRRLRFMLGGAEEFTSGEIEFYRAGFSALPVAGAVIEVSDEDDDDLPLIETITLV